MKSLSLLFFLLFILLNIYFCVYPVLHGDVNFLSDVARDFLLLREIDEKKIILIGPRSNSSGLFHGPLWSYVNYPVYRLAKGNPVIVGWYWIFLALSALGIGFAIAKKLFGTLAGLTFTLLYATNFITHINGMFHSDAPVFLTPLLFFSMLLYVERKKIRYLVLHLFFVSIIIQLNVGVGIPVLILSTILSLYLIFRRRFWNHLSAFLVLSLTLLNFIVFDIRHSFLLTKSAYAFWQLQKTWNPLPLSFLLINRFNETINLRVIFSENFYLQIFIFLLTVIMTVIEFKKSSKFKSVYLLILYYYLGYMLLTFTNKGVILSHFVYFLAPLSTLWFASFVRGQSKIFMMAILFVIAVFNLQQSVTFIKRLQTDFIGKRQESWKALSLVAETITKRQGNNQFGYFVFSPDAFAYGPRYAMLYNFAKAKAASFEYVKKDVTYIVAAPAPQGDPEMNYNWWRKNPVKIISEPIFTQNFPGGFTIEEYQLSQKEQLIPHDKTIELGIHFR
ncbi:hypothetical protein HY338_02490 [Candidatus Gottesmanbacteria bacterium]|nr:hypothetical protein [Candidatus Gottesmanbacteria bacterium]